MRAVVVVGGGIAGTLAAVAAGRAGARTVILAPRPGASALAGGALGLGATLDSLPEHHPLRSLGMGPVRLASEVDAGVRELVSVLERGGAPVAGDWRRPGLYADLHGRPRAAALVPRAAAPGELAALRDGRRQVLVVGIERVSDYDARSTAEALKELCGVAAVAEVVTMQGLPAGAGLGDVAGRPAPRVSARGPALIAYPPGLTGLPENGFELLAGIPSPFGLALHRALEAAGGGRRAAEAKSLVVDDGRIAGVETSQGLEPAAAVVLATGRFIGGGLEMRGLPAERLAGAAAWSGGVVAHLDRALSRHLYIEAGAVSGLGVRTDDRLRPLDEDGRVLLPNLWAAGALLAGHEPEAASLLAAVTGRLAGEWAAAA